MDRHILITGGSGLVGKHLTALLLDKGYTVSHLSRKENHIPKVKTYLWDIQKGTIDENCINNVDIIVHLAGAGVADERWTDERKQEIINSRTQSIRLIYTLLKQHPHQVRKVVSASATGYYSDRGDELMTEESSPAGDFLGKCCIDWEQAVDEGETLGLEILKFRTGVVLTDEGGALKQLALPVKLGFGAMLGSGKQWVPWIHLQDTIDLYLFGIENPLAGVYNMVAPNPVTNAKLTITAAIQLHRPLWLPKVPAFALKLFFGEMGTVVLGSTKVSAAKTEQAGFAFKFPTIKEALKEIYAR
ncbi:TIGR01777 family oxidoreductase [Mucilaginibacter arboris]|uniref:TIGR01777 family protein n=1 Tax=Mucilaginibacter arboris TaxID=2682090 RepID=A0A7K1SWR5_9SPHI|nr:TIGR01777 family oxidoreductase [Mucilaginibacter arboris]MVN21688.1 TIGR01777 family protein [Mucilaginibacter arboris]